MEAQTAACLVVLASVTAASSYVTLPLWSLMLVYSLVCIHLGSKRSIKLSPHSEIVNPDPSAIMNAKEASKMPIMAGCMLLGLYVLLKYIDKELVSLVLSTYFAFLSTLCFKDFLLPLIQQKLPKLKGKYSKIVKLPLLYDEPVEFVVTTHELVGIALGAPVALLYLYTRHWALNNIIGVAFSVFALESIPVSSFPVGYLLLGGMFFFDIFFVFGTDVMVTVARGIDAPIKLLFPKPNGEFSILGLGDIILPGVFISLAYRYDFFLRVNKKTGPYYRNTIIGYVLGLATTVAIMLAFDTPQPALLYLVPAVLLAHAGTAVLRGEVKEVWAYTEDAPHQE
jgi:minor histocompatibility antigen H13